MGDIENIFKARQNGETDQPSTGVVEDGGQIFIKPSHFEMGTIKKRIWSVIKSLGDEANLLNQLFHQAVSIDGTLASEAPVSSAEDSVSSETSSAASVTPHNTTSSPHVGGASPIPPPTSSSDSEEDEMLSILKEAMEADHWDEVKDLFEDTILISNNDTGGHAEFFDIQAALIQGPSFNLLFSRLQDKLDKVFEIHYTNKEGVSTDNEESTMTVEEVLYQALAGIACYGGKQSMDANASMAQGASKVMFVCTHMDTVEKEKRERVFKEKDGLLRKKIESTEFYRRDMIEYVGKDQLMLGVDNMHGDSAEIENIRSIFLRVINNCFNKKIKVPASWFALSLYLRKKFRTILLKECEEIASKLGIDPKELPDALWFLHHRVGALLYYPEVKAMKDTVICHMQVVFDSASNLIHNTYTFDKVGHRLYREFKEKGQFSLKDVKEATLDHTDSLIPLSKLVKLFQHHNIITTIIPTGSDNTAEPTYFMPCALPSARDSELNIPIGDHDPAPLLLQYDCGYMPVGVFPALITNLVSQEQKGWMLIEEGIYKNKVQFHVGDDFDIVTLISHPRYFQISISRAVDFKESTESVCADVRCVFKSTLENVTSCMKHKLKYKFGFECPTHPGKEHLCVLNENNSKMLCLENQRRSKLLALQARHKVWFFKPPAAKSSGMWGFPQGGIKLQKMLRNYS